MRFYLSVCLLLLSGTYAHAALTKWVDSDGQVHYSDGPPPVDTKAQSVAIPAAASGVPGQKTLNDQLMELKQKQQTEAENAQKDAKQREKNLAKEDHCNRLRANLQTLQTGGRIVTPTASGESVFMDDAMIQQGIKDVQKRISAECN
jgi:hypothetical protein